MRLGAVLALPASILILAACAEENVTPTPGPAPRTSTAAAPVTTPVTSEPAIVTPNPTSNPAESTPALTHTPAPQSSRTGSTPGPAAALTPTPDPTPEPTAESPEDESAKDAPFDDLEIVTLLPYDAIPAILDPTFVSAEDAWYQYASDETVLGLSINGDHRAYSIPYLSSREIVNDVVGGVPVAVTW